MKASIDLASVLLRLLVDSWSIEDPVLLKCVTYIRLRFREI